MTDLVIVEKRSSVATVTLNRPDSMNALSQAMMKALTAAFRSLQQDQDIAAVILTGAGKAFCAGLDLKELSEKSLEGFKLEGDHDIESAILEFDRPVIGAINGVAATGGFELALWCDMLVATNTARFVDTHARVGLVPGWGLSQRLSRMIGINRARELSFTGNFLPAQQAESWGLVNRVVDAADLLPTCESIAKDISSCHRTTLVRYKRVINEGAGMSLQNALTYEKLAMDLHSATQGSSDISERRESVINRGRTQT
ncbi:enoyl-CoA hydratase [Spongiibacter sp. KMU-166]|uniref:Enoyl-CoA hydratase n=1 Tax=Spongiibacter thalassae TaxID=2721624 RepID=A0ABX1G9J9_9GAMM|nr:enoyl-CoA hydratase [Spongiibacter thalassae]NKI15835.1 enoyl-CoA hydratase [Spongiibacter thalassae]